jgi:hypothetical protein
MPTPTATPTPRCVTSEWAGEIPVIECEALLSLYDSTGGDQWYDRTGWLGFESPCTWHGVTCRRGHVARIDLHDNELTGSIPPELGNLSQLLWLRLHGNQLTGDVPPELVVLCTRNECLFTR